MALAYSNLGALLQSRGEVVEAESLYLKTIALRPNYALAWNNLGAVRYRRGEAGGAARAFRRAIELKPDDAGAVYNLGRLYSRPAWQIRQRSCLKGRFGSNPAIRR